MWQMKRQCLLDTLKEDIGDSVFISNTFPLRSGISIRFPFLHFLAMDCYSSVETNSARQSNPADL